MTSSIAHPSELTLHRLLRRREAATLLEEFSRLLPGGDLALVETDGRVYAGSAAWQETALQELQAQARDAQVLCSGGVMLQPLVVQSQPVGALVARAGASQGAVLQEEAVLRSIHVSLKLIFAQALEISDIAHETLAQYREIKLLYRVGEEVKERLGVDEIERQRMEEELAIGHKIQLSLLPLCCPAIAGWEFSAAYCPARYVGGDLYDFIQSPDEPHQLGMLIADVTGKGIPAALLMAFSRAVIRSESMNHLSPAIVLQRANHLILEDVRYNLFLSAFFARLDTRSGRVVYANGGHDWPLWFQAQSGKIHFLTTPGMVLGMRRDAGLEERTVELGSGDILVFYTDGVTETRNPKGEFFDEQGLVAVVQANSNASAEELGDAIYSAVVEFAGTEPFHDDLAFVIVKRM